MQSLRQRKKREATLRSDSQTVRFIEEAENCYIPRVVYIQCALHPAGGVASLSPPSILIEGIWGRGIWRIQGKSWRRIPITRVGLFVTPAPAPPALRLGWFASQTIHHCRELSVLCAQVRSRNNFAEKTKFRPLAGGRRYCSDTRGPYHRSLLHFTGDLRPLSDTHPLIPTPVESLYGIER